MTLGEVLAGATDYLAKRGVESARLDAERLLARALGLSRIELYTQHDRPLTEAERDAARDLVQRRGAREPLAYVLGDWDFRRLTLRTDARALVPRPETEIVVERCLELIRDLDAPRVLDVGTGSGAIALAVAHEHRGARVVATDLSEAALELAAGERPRARARRHLPARRPARRRRRPVRPVVSNPPYVKQGELEALEPEVRDWEPRAALVDVGQTERLVADATRVLTGWLVLEVHEHHACEVAALLANAGYDSVRMTLDLAGKERVVEARWQQTR